jgi:hypothetical protein
MDLPSLETASRALEQALDFWGVLLLWSTLIVVVGLLFEYWEPIRSFFGEWHRPAAVFPSGKFWELFGGLLVTVGVAGELWFTYQASRVETELRNNNHRIEALLTKEANDAATSAHNAAIDAGKAKEQSKSAQEKAVAAGVASGDAMKRSDAADEAASDALARLSAVNWNVDVLAKAVNPRTLDRKVFLAELAGKPKGTAEIWYEPNDPEAMLFASDLHNYLGTEGAGWQVEDIKPLSGAWDSNNLKYSERMSTFDKERFEANFTADGVQVTENRDSWYDIEGKTSGGALRWAIKRGLGEFRSGGNVLVDPSLPDDHFVIVIGHHWVLLPLGEFPWQNATPPPAQAKQRNKTR